MRQGMIFIMNNSESYYARINCIFDLEFDSSSLIISLTEADVRKIIRTLNKLINNLSVEFAVIEMEMLTFDIFMGDYARIKIVDNQLYVQRNDVLEILIDQDNLVRDIILEKAIKKNYDDLSVVMDMIYPDHSARKRKPIKTRHKDR